MAKRITTAPIAEIITGTDIVTLETLMGNSGVDLDALEAEINQLEAIASSTVDSTLEPGYVPDTQASEEVQAPEASDETQAPAEEEVTEPLVDLKDAIKAVDEADIENMQFDTGKAFDARLAFEVTKNAAAEGKIGESLKKSRTKLMTGPAAAVLIATSVSPDFINRSINSGSGYNVYAIDKVADIVAGLSGGIMRNAINVAICKSLFAFRAAGAEFTGEMAKAAASGNIRVQGAVAKLLVRHTVSPSTAPTQASSTTQALQTLGIVTNKGTAKHPIYALTNSPATNRLQEVLGIAA